jgi:hypothetical protein
MKHEPTKSQPLEYADAEPRRFGMTASTRQALNTRLAAAGRWSGRIALGFVILLTLAVGFGTSASDAEKMRLFADAVDRWQHNPDFRQVQIEYVEMGSDAMRSDIAFVPSKKVIMWLRSLPGLPDHLKVNDTSFSHYEDFTYGPLSAYMHLTGEQGVSETLKMLQYRAQSPKLTDDDIRAFLAEYKLHNPVVNDAGAIASVRSLINDVDAARKFEVTSNVGDHLKPHIAAVAKSLGYPTDIHKMNPAAQLEVWQMLDDEIRQTDYELWRTKQVNDWLNGVWAQVYGTMYSGIIGPTLTIREISRVAGPLLLMGWVGVGLWKRRKEASEPLTPTVPRFALQGGSDKVSDT